MGSPPAHVGTPFVGRDRELRLLEAAVDAALRGEGVGTVVVGDAGIGKTRLTSEAVAAARANGLRVAQASAWEPGGAPAHWHWVQVLRSLAAAQDRRSLVEAFGADASELARLVPDLRSGVVLGPAQSADGDDPRFRMYDAVVSFLRISSTDAPVLVVLEDLHAGDVGSAHLLRFVLAEMRADRVAVIATMRDVDGEPVADDLRHALVDVQRAAVAVRLGGLNRRDVDRLLAHVAPADARGRLGASIHERSGGNPLFVTELGQLLAGDPRQREHPLPPTIRAVLERRLGVLEHQSREVLRVAAVAGEEVDVPLVTEVAGVAREHVLAALDDALRARLVAERAPGGFEFAHALVREALYEELPLLGRAQLHRAIGEALEGRAGVEAPLSELARHFLAAEPIAQDERAVDYAERAGQHAVAQFAYDDAAAHFRSSLAAAERAGVSGTRRVSLLLALGGAALRAGDLPGARDAFVAAADDARSLGRADLLAEAALGLGSGLDGFEVRLFDHAQVTLLEDALAQLDPAPSALRAWATARLSVANTFVESTPRRLELADQAIAIARAVGEPAALAYALAARCDATAGPEHIDERRGAADEIVRLAMDVGDRGTELLGRRNRLIALLEAGDIAGVDDEIERYERVADGLAQPLYQWYVPLWRGMRALMEGRVHDATRHRDHAAALGARCRSDNAVLNTEVLAWCTLLKEGHWTEAADRLAAQLPLASGIYSEAFWVPLVTPWLHPTAVASTLQRFTAERFARLPRDAVWLAAMSFAADSARVCDDADAAGLLYELIEPFASRFAVDAIGAACFGSMHRPLGVLATVLRREADAIAHLDAALDAHRAVGASALVAETLADLGATRTTFGDAIAGQRTLDEARALYGALGMDHRDGLISTMDHPDRHAGPTGNVFRREGEHWVVTYAGRTTRLADAKGMHDIAALLGAAGRELHVADLVALVDPAADDANGRARAAELRRGRLDEVLDAPARAAYRARLEDLRDDLAEAEANDDLGRAEVARAAMDVLAGELAAAVGIGGRGRGLGDAGERARKAVTQRIRNTIKRMDAVHPELAAHLDRSVRTGRFCSYAPERPTEWSL